MSRPLVQPMKGYAKTEDFTSDADSLTKLI